MSQKCKAVAEIGPEGKELGHAPDVDLGLLNVLDKPVSYYIVSTWYVQRVAGAFTHSASYPITRPAEEIQVLVAAYACE